MDGRLVVRFNEHTRYDIQNDCSMVVFLATVDKGSYFAEVEERSTKYVREKRKEFKDRAVEYIKNNVEPQRIEL